MAIEREEKWDIIKGFAIWLVVLGHLTTQPQMKNMIYVIHMPIFFIVSGYFAYYSFEKYSVKQVIKSKFRTIFIPFITWSAVAVIMNCLKEFFMNGVNLGLFLAKIKAVYVTSMSVWFLWVLFAIFLCFSGAYQLHQKIGKGRFIYYCLVAWIIMCACLPNNLFSFNKIKINFWWFVLGYALHCMKFENRSCDIIKKISILYIPLYFLVFSLIKVDDFYSWYSFQFDLSDISKMLWVCSICVLYTLLGVIFVHEWVVPFMHRIKLKNVFKKCGKQTLEIYTMHMMFVSYIVIIPEFVEGNIWLCNFLYLPIYALLICCGIVLLTGILHKIKLYKVVMLGKLN